MTRFQINDPSLESQWRAIILFGKNSATYKFAFAKSLLELVNNETTRIIYGSGLEDKLAIQEFLEKEIFLKTLV